MGIFGSIGDFFKKIGGWFEDFWDWVKRNWKKILMLAIIIAGLLLVMCSESKCEKQCKDGWWEINGHLSEQQCIRMCEENKNAIQ